MHFKDAVLDSLATRANVAQFVSFDPHVVQRYARVRGYPANTPFEGVRTGIAAVFDGSADHSVNIRSFAPEDPKSREFVYGLTNIDDAERVVRRLAADGLHTIVNETIDVHDGGVSGVILGDVLEFAPEDTPRCVEQPGTASLPRDLGIRLLRAVYGFTPVLSFPESTRVEFSIHPLRRGVRQEHTVVWETEEVGQRQMAADLRWPNRFSQFIGDKTFGLLVAHLLGLPVPLTTVIGRRIAPFSFGVSTLCKEPWIRTCPATQNPGKFTTRRGWLDPFQLMQAEDPSGTAIASILAQEGVDAAYSGAAIGTHRSVGSATTTDPVLIEGTAGFGEDFMVGLKPRSDLPANVIASVRRTYRRAARILGPVRIEWVYDTRRTWIVQFHRGGTESTAHIVVPGNPRVYRRFLVADGLEALRTLVSDTVGTGDGIRIVGDVGVTSHYGDILRKAGLPSIIVAPEGDKP